jgi:hypothetical protein
LQQGGACNRFGGHVHAVGVEDDVHAVAEMEEIFGYIDAPQGGSKGCLSVTEKPDEAR